MIIDCFFQSQTKKYLLSRYKVENYFKKAQKKRERESQCKSCFLFAEIFDACRVCVFSVYTFECECALPWHTWNRLNPDPGQLYIFLCLVCARWLVHIHMKRLQRLKRNRYAMVRHFHVSGSYSLVHSADQNTFRTSVVLLIFCSEFPCRMQ